jgi:hypothetical protein
MVEAYNMAIYNFSEKLLPRNASIYESLARVIKVDISGSHSTALFKRLG